MLPRGTEPRYCDECGDPYEAKKVLPADSSIGHLCPTCAEKALKGELVL